MIVQLILYGPNYSAIDSPKFISADKVDFIKPKDRVIGVYRDGVAKAYPIRILNWHEVVNDSIGEHPIVVTYCPLCGTATPFDVDSAQTGLACC